MNIEQLHHSLRCVAEKARRVSENCQPQQTDIWKSLEQSAHRTCQMLSMLSEYDSNPAVNFINPDKVLQVVCSIIKSEGYSCFETKSTDKIRRQVIKQSVIEQAKDVVERIYNVGVSSALDVLG